MLELDTQWRYLLPTANSTLAYSISSVVSGFSRDLTEAQRRTCPCDDAEAEGDALVHVWIHRVWHRCLDLHMQDGIECK